MSSRRRVLLVGSSYFDTVIDSFHRALKPFYDVVVFDPFSALGKLEHRLGPATASRINATLTFAMRVVTREPLTLSLPRLRRVATEHAPDYILVDCIESIPGRVVAELRNGNRDAKIFGVFSDAVTNFGRGYFFHADYDRLFFKDRYIVDRLRSRLGWDHVFYLPQACDRQLHRPVELSPHDIDKYACDITLAGNGYPWRMEILRPLVGRNVKVWGGGPPSWLEHPAARLFTHRYVAGLEKSKALRAAKIALNPNHYAEINGTNKRTFETAGAGAFQLTDTPALSDVFDTETEVATYRTAEELLEKIDYYLRHPELRDAMAARAQVRAHAQHTYEHRWVALLDSVGASPPSTFPVSRDDLQVRAIST